MNILVKHQTRYRYDTPVAYSIQRLRLTPKPFEGQQTSNWRIDIPGIDRALEYTDGLGNKVQTVTLLQDHEEILLSVTGEVQTSDTNGVIKGLQDEPPLSIFLRDTQLTQPDKAISKLAESIDADSELNRAHALMQSIREQVSYQTDSTDSTTTAAEALKQGQGVCQDHSHIFISACRALNIPARYVTGYLVIDDEHNDDVTTAEAHHAWAEAHIKDLGWVAFDVANGICADERYVRLAAGLDFKSAAPLRGSRRGGESESLEVVVSAQQQ